MIEKRWTIKAADEELLRSLSNDLPTVNPIIHRLLALRGISNYHSAKDFFRPDLSQLHDPFLMKDMAKAVDRITEAVNKKERILIYGDYDVDGTTAVAVVYSFLKENSPGELSFYIPHRYREGYGLSKQGIEFAQQNGFKLIITLDCGIKSVDLINDAQSAGIDVIVCDHHTPDKTLPNALAILNPKQSDCDYPYAELSGCGIGYKLISALATKWDLPIESVHQYLDLVATSIAADIVPMTGENRIMAFYGLKRVNEQPSLPIVTLRKIANIQRPMNITDLVFVIGPRVNAAGRMDDARKAVDFFIETDPVKSEELAQALHADNFERKEIDKSITEEALNLIRSDEILQQRKTTVLYQPHWHKGVVGIVASRLIDHFYRPTIVLTSSNGKVSGSARSISGFNIYEAIHECRDLLDNYGGHFYAAGMTMSEQVVNAFVEKFEQVVTERITTEMLTPEILIDAEIQLSDIKPKFFGILNQFEPFGPENLKPVFLTRNVSDFNGYSRTVKESHLKVVITQSDGTVVSGIGFGMSGKYSIVSSGRPFDIVYTIDENEYNGQISLQIKVIDIRPSDFKSNNFDYKSESHNILTSF